MLSSNHRPPVEFLNIFSTQILITPCLAGIGGKWKKQLFKSWKYSLEIKTSRTQALIVRLSSPSGLLKGNLTFPESEEIISVHITQVGLRTSSFPDSKNWNSNTHVTPPLQFTWPLLLWLLSPREAHLNPVVASVAHLSLQLSAQMPGTWWD